MNNTQVLDSPLAANITVFLSFLCRPFPVYTCSSSFFSWNQTPRTEMKVTQAKNREEWVKTRNCYGILESRNAGNHGFNERVKLSSSASNATVISCVPPSIASSYNLFIIMSLEIPCCFRREKEKTLPCEMKGGNLSFVNHDGEKLHDRGIL